MVKKGERKILPSNADVEKYEMLSPMLDCILDEMKGFSKKSQDGVLNKLKVAMANKILEKVKDLLSKEPHGQFLNLLDDETLPSNSDAVLVLAQFKVAMDEFGEKYYCRDEVEHTWRWFTKENP